MRTFHGRSSKAKSSPYIVVDANILRFDYFKMLPFFIGKDAPMPYMSDNLDMSPLHRTRCANYPDRTSKILSSCDTTHGNWNCPTTVFFVALSWKANRLGFKMPISKG